MPLSGDLGWGVEPMQIGRAILADIDAYQSLKKIDKRNFVNGNNEVINIISEIGGMNYGLDYDCIECSHPKLKLIEMYERVLGS
ncbi:hypothetical protein ABFY09_09185 [Marinomonas sp. 5E14-1]|uniref:hypothetical protein n=1 Tax=Marinomonas sp. 5E14-1 TaxID=3153922 RepID=UPI003266AD48